MLTLAHQDFLGKYFKADDHYMNDEAPVAWLQNSKNITPEDINKSLDNTNESHIRREAIKHINASKENISKALADENDSVGRAAIQNPNVTKEHIDAALYHRDDYVRYYAIKNPNVTRENLLTALADPEYTVRSFARRHPRYKEYFPNGHQ